MKGRFPWIRTEANFKRYLDLAPVSGKVWPSWSMFQAGWISQDGWNSASEVFHGLWAKHRLLSHLSPQTVQNPREEQRFGYLSLKSYHMCQNSDEMAPSDLPGELDTFVCTQGLSPDTDEQISAGAYPAASWEDSVLWQRGGILPAWAGLLCTDHVEKHLGSRVEPLLDPPQLTLTFSLAMPRGCAGKGCRAPVRVQPCLAGVQHKMLMLLLPSVLACTLHGWWYLEKKTNFLEAVRGLLLFSGKGENKGVHEVHLLT